MGKALRLAAVAVALLVAPAAALASELRDFRVLRNGEDIGHHRVAISRAGDDTKVKVEIRLRVTLGPLTLFRYSHDADETWQGDRLVALHSTTDNDGRQEYLSISSGRDGLVAAGSRYSGRLPADAMPTSYWHPDFVRRSHYIDSQNGRQLDLKIERRMVELASLDRAAVPAQRFQFSGDVNLSLWYDESGNWVKTAFVASDGSAVDYRLQ